jgi:hypothetical protein
MSACYNRRLLGANCSFSYAVAEIFYGYATETERPWGLRQPWTVNHRGAEGIPAIEALIAQLLHAGYWIEAGEGLRLADARDLTAYWRWFDAERERRRLARQIPGTLRQRILARDNHRCVLCGSISSIVIDHIHPVAAGGGNDEANLRTLCRQCNAERNLPTPPHAIYPG